MGGTSGPDQSTSSSPSAWGGPPWGGPARAGTDSALDPGGRAGPSSCRVAHVAAGWEPPRGATPGTGTGRKCHNAMLTTVEEVHRKTGVTSIQVLRMLSETALGVARFKSLHLDRFQTAASALASTRRTAVRHRVVDTGDPNPPGGRSASLDLTHNFPPDSEGNVCAAIFLDLSTWSIWVGPMKNRTCSEFVRNLKEYQSHVRDTYEQDLREVRTDNDLCFTDVKAGPPPEHC